MEAQLSLFTNTNQTNESKKVKDIRTDAQTSRKVAYDVGEKVGFARKDLHILRQKFTANKSVQALNELEDCSNSLAAELVTKKELFSGFSLETEKDNNVEPIVARLKQLIIQRIDTHPKDTPECRKSFLIASHSLISRFNTLFTEDEFSLFIKEMNNQMIYEGMNIDLAKRRVKRFQQELSEADPDDESANYSIINSRLATATEQLFLIQEASKMNYSILGKKFKNFFTVQSSLNSSLKAVSKIKSWDELLQPKKVTIERKSNKPVWERSLPERPDRIGGRESFIRKAEEMVTSFNFRGVEFGHYVDDQKGLEHIFRCSEAFMDLADVLGVHESHLALNTLALGFGSRGRGKALGHYERANKVINFTKEKGTLGVACHEYAHFLDSMLYCASYGYKNGKVEYLSELENYGSFIPDSLVAAMKDLMLEIQEGNSVAFFSNENKEGTSWRISYTTKQNYKSYNGDLFLLMKAYKEKQKSSMSYHISMLSSIEKEKEMEKLEKRQMRDLKKYAQALAWLHEKETGIRVDSIPYPSNDSQLMQASITLDRGKRGKYWSNPCELFARCFEAWVEDTLRKEGRRSDYLVCGTQDSLAYAVAEEREHINEKMSVLMNEIVAYMFK